MLPGAGSGDIGVGMVGFIASDMGTHGLTTAPDGSFFELHRGSEVGLWDDGVGSGGRTSLPPSCTRFGLLSSAYMCDFRK